MRICINPSDLCLVVEERKTKLPRSRAQGMYLGWEVGHIQRRVSEDVTVEILQAWKGVTHQSEAHGE